MAEEINANLVLNLEGLLCPLPIVKVSQAIKQVEIGQVVEASATAPGVMIDIPAWAKTTGNEMLKTQKEGKVIRFWVKRNK
jgi:tRNA 2-thiouridine synthesizing protein A